MGDKILIRFELNTIWGEFPLFEISHSRRPISHPLNLKRRMFARHTVFH